MGNRMREFDRPGMEKHAPQTRNTSGDILIQGKIPVLVISHYRKPEISKVHANLMGTSGFQFSLQQAEALPRFPQDENSMGTHSTFFLISTLFHRDPPFAGRCQIFPERQLDTLSCIMPPALDQRQVVLFHLSNAKLPM